MKITDKRIVKKFGLYGFFKNLKFFEPFLYIFLIQVGLSFFQIGTLISVREITRNIFEVPSGIFADHYGRKKTLQLCFIFYIISFIIFFFSSNFIMVIPAMFLYGMGEAFRSGTHKGIIFSYLDYHQQADQKVEVYGFTKSYSLIGSSLSALIGATILFISSNYRLVFIFSVLPYIIDFFLISSYPDYVDGVTDGDISIEALINGVKRSFSNIKNVVNLRKGLINSSIYDGYFKALQDYLQPVLKTQIAGISLFMFTDTDKQLALLLGFSYFIINIITSYTTRNAYRLKKYSRGSYHVLNILFIITVATISLIGLFTYLKLALLVIFIYLLYYIFRNVRRPFMLDYLGDIMEKDERVTMLSLESQLTTIIIIIVSPLLGAIADLWGLGAMFFTAAISMSILYSLILLKEDG